MCYIIPTVVVLSSSGISEEKTFNPVQLATMKAERIAREKAAAAQNVAVRNKIQMMNLTFQVFNW